MKTFGLKNDPKSEYLFNIKPDTKLLFGSFLNVVD